MMHEGKEFYEQLLDFMCSGTTVALHLERVDAVAKLLELVGDTDPEEKPKHHPRHVCRWRHQNAVHASDSPLSAKRNWVSSSKVHFEIVFRTRRKKPVDFSFPRALFISAQY